MSNYQPSFIRTTKSMDPTQCFVLMPFKNEYEEIYQDVIKPLVEGLGFRCLRADEIYRSTDIMHDIWENIQISGLIIADMTGKNSNVFYELGLSHALGKEVILITQSLDDVPFDLRRLRCIVYKHSLRGAVELAEQLKKHIVQVPVFARLPVEFLEERFVGRFTAKHINFTMKFGNNRGTRTEVVEHYSIVPHETDLPEFYKKIQVAGSVTEAEFDIGLVDIKTLFPGMYILSVGFSPALKKEAEHKFSMQYTLENSFSNENEYWFYNTESLTDELEGKFIFLKSSDVRDFKVYFKKENSEELITEQPKSQIKGSSLIFTWHAKMLKPPDCYIFRWTWR